MVSEEPTNNRQVFVNAQWHMGRPQSPGEWSIVSRSWSSERGSVTIMTAVLLVGLVLVLGLSIDVSRIYMVRTGLQNAADAAALAAARELNSGPTGLTNAVAQANAIVNQYGLNRSGAAAPNVTISKIEFATQSGFSTNTWYVGAGGVPPQFVSTIKYVQVTTQAASVNILFAAQAIGSNHVEARTAVAGMSIGLNTVCDYVPLAVAKTSPTTPFPTGTELTLQFVAADALSLTNQNFIVLQTNGSESANKTRDASAGITPICTTIGTSVTVSSSQSAQGSNGPSQIELGLNTRLDYYSGGMKASDAGPDTNVFEASTFANFNWSNYKSGSPTQAPKVPDQPYAQDNRRIIIMPIVDVGPVNSGSVQVKSFGAFLFLRKVTNPSPSKCKDVPNPCGHVQVEYLGDNLVVGRGSYNPNGGVSTLTKAVLYK